MQGNPRGKNYTQKMSILNPIKKYYVRVCICIIIVGLASYFFSFFLMYFSWENFVFSLKELLCSTMLSTIACTVGRQKLPQQNGSSKAQAFSNFQYLTCTQNFNGKRWVWFPYINMDRDRDKDHSDTCISFTPLVGILKLKVVVLRGGGFEMEKIYGYILVIKWAFLVSETLTVHRRRNDFGIGGAEYMSTLP